jgi:DAK2 domain fusion protein YloV
VVRIINGKTLRDAIISGANRIAAYRADLDRLNVFPIPDGDTGANMSMTVTAARDALLKLPDGCTVAESAKVAASAMLRNARGNSGMITSLLFNGFSKSLAEKDTADAKDMAAAFAQGVSAAYKSVMKPVEGTILTVARVASEKAAADKPDDTKKLWDILVKSARIALSETTGQLKVLKKAGVVDAGGKGLCLMLEGMRDVISAEKTPAPAEIAIQNTESAVEETSPAQLGQEWDSRELNIYCVEFALNSGQGANSAKLRNFLGGKGNSVVVAEDSGITKCHVHTAQPAKILKAAMRCGRLVSFKVENMREMYMENRGDL